MASRVPPPDGAFGAVAEGLGRMSRGVEDSLRIGGDQFADLARRVQQIADLQTALAAQQVVLGQQQAALAQQVSFLQGQTTFAVNTAVFSDISTNTLWGFNGAYDVAVTVVAGSTGKLWCTVNAGCLGSGITKGPIVGVEASWSGGAHGFANSDTVDATAYRYGGTVSRSYMITAPAGATVTVRTRRGATPSVNEQIIVTGVSLAVTKVGM